YGPPVRYDVVHCYQQRMFIIADANQAATDQRSSFQIEGRCRFRGCQLFQLRLGVGLSSKFMLVELKLTWLVDHLYRRAVQLRECRSERFVPLDDSIECAPQRLPIELS